MTDLLGIKKIGNKLVKVENIFSENLVNFLYEDCKKQLKFNLSEESLLEDNDIRISKCILDCHGLRICGGKGEKIKNDLTFPYSTKNWNIFCIKMQNIMFKYCDKFGIDKSQIAPHSCWVERSYINKFEFGSKQLNILDDTDEFLNTWLNSKSIPHYRILYFLKTPDYKRYGLGIRYENTILTLPAEENSLYIVPTDENECYTQYSTDTEDNFVLMFDWYLHPKNSTMVPAWRFPNKYNYKVFKEYIKHTIEQSDTTHSVQKILFKHYLKIFKKQLEKTLDNKS